MTLAIEPMVGAGTWRTRVLSDGWTVVMADGKRCGAFRALRSQLPKASRKC